MPTSYGLSNGIHSLPRNESDVTCITDSLIANCLSKGS
jgi:hypothetical protein